MSKGLHWWTSYRWRQLWRTSPVLPNIIEAAVAYRSCPEDDCGEENTVWVRCKGENIRKEGSQPVEQFLHSVRAGTL